MEGLVSPAACLSVTCLPTEKGDFVVLELGATLWGRRVLKCHLRLSWPRLWLMEFSGIHRQVSWGGRLGISRGWVFELAAVARASPGTGRGGGAYREPPVKVSSAPRQEWGEPWRRGSGFRCTAMPLVAECGLQSERAVGSLVMVWA